MCEVGWEFAAWDSILRVPTYSYSETTPTLTLSLATLLSNSKPTSHIRYDGLFFLPHGFIIIIITLFQEDNIFGASASPTYGPQLQLQIVSV